jgi:hypothetical protein
MGFWKFKWYGNQPLCELFPDLFAKEVSKNALVAARLDGSGDELIWRWQWCDSLSIAEGHQLEELMGLFEGFTYQPSSSDEWRWMPDSNMIFSVKFCYTLLLDLQQGDSLEATLLTAINKLWKTDIPSKIYCLDGGYY